jgi:CheY-like chemotaxis protein
VLVVDDEPQIRLLVKTLLSEEGFESIEASDGCSAFATLRKLDGAISLLLTDIEIPGSPMNGIELAGAVRSEFPEVPVLFVSGQSPTTDLNSAAPRNEFVKKPFDPRVFADRLASWSWGRHSPITARFVVNWAVRREELCGHGFVPMLRMIRVSGYHISGGTASISVALVTRFTMPSQIARHLAAGGVAEGSLERPLKYKYKGGVPGWRLYRKNH